MKRFLIGFVCALCVLLLVPVGWLGFEVGPYVHDKVLLDRVTRAVALDWRDFGYDVARARLQYELDHQGIGVWVGDSDCAMEQGEDGTREVRCDFVGPVEVPFAERTVGLPFSALARLDRDGALQ